MLQTIRPNDAGDVVRAAQELTGYSAQVLADGVFTATFEAAVKAWQRTHGLAADGVIGPDTWTAIRSEAVTVGQNRNRTHPHVRALQLLLGGLDADGIFGPKTRAAVVAYQSANGLSVDGICGQETWGCVILGKDTPVVPDWDPTKRPVDYKQYDSRWKSVMYSNHGDKKQTMSSSACGPTSVADIIASWWDASVTPVEVAQWSLGWGCRTYDNGTTADLFRRIAEKYKPSKYIHWTSSVDSLKQCLADGGLAIVCFKPSKWTSGGHYCCIYRWDGDLFYVNDPASAAANRQTGTEAEVKNARKGFCLFWPSAKTEVVEDAAD